jgi:hypothetical protein
MKRDGPDHPKVKKLAKLLKINRAWAVGVCECLWHATAKLCPQGDIGKLTDFEIAEEVFWVQREGNMSIRRAEHLVNILRCCGLLEENIIYRYVVHDWKTHAPESVRKYLSRHGLDFVGTVSPQPQPQPQPLPQPQPASRAREAAAAASPPAGEPLGPHPRSQAKALARLSPDEVCAQVLREMDEEGLLPPRLLENEYGRIGPNPVTKRVEEALRRALDRIRTARSPARLARRIILDELEGAS